MTAERPTCVSMATVFAPISAPPATFVFPRRIGERLHDDVGLELDGRLDPGRRGVDDRDAAQHVLLVDAVAQDRAGLCELDPRVHAFRLAVILGDVRRHLLAGGDEDLDRVGQVELALDVLRLQLLERGPELVGAEDVDRRVDLADRALVVRRVGSFGDPQHGAVGATDDPAVDARIGRLGDRIVAAACSRWCVSTSRSRSSGVSRGVSPESTSTSPAWSPIASRATRTASPVPSGVS